MLFKNSFNFFVYNLLIMVVITNIVIIIRYSSILNLLKILISIKVAKQNKKLIYL